MKKLSTKLFNIALVAGLLITGVEANAQTTFASAETMTKKDAPKEDAAATKTETKKDDPIDTAWHPQRRVWGYAFGDFSYVGHAPAVTSSLGKENNYANVPTGRNTFQFRRIYLGYDYDITKKFKAEMLLASEPTENTAIASGSVLNGDVTADNKMSFYIKNFNLRARDVWNGTDFVIGEMGTPGFALNEPGTNAPTSLSEATWGYRSIERTITDFHKNNSFDVGAALQGTFDPKTKNYGYVLMVGNNTQANVVNIYGGSGSTLSPTNPNPSGFFKIYYGDLWGKFLNKKLYVDVYADYAQTSSSIANTTVTAGSLQPLEHNMFKVFAAYTVPKFTFGVEAYTQKLNNALIDNTTKTANDATVNAISLFAKGVLTKDWNWFARFDSYDPDTKFDGTHNYSAVSGGSYSSFDPTVKEQFYTAGLDYNPTKNVHFMPNIWLTRYSSEYDKTVTTYVPDNHTLVYRMTFFYTFGK